MNQTGKQHHLAVSLLELLDLREIRIELKRDGSFTFVGWTAVPVKHNGGGKAVRRGSLTLK